MARDKSGFVVLPFKPAARLTTNSGLEPRDNLASRGFPFDRRQLTKIRCGIILPFMDNASKSFEDKLGSSSWLTATLKADAEAAFPGISSTRRFEHFVDLFCRKKLRGGFASVFETVTSPAPRTGNCIIRLRITDDLRADFAAAANERFLTTNHI